jgi:hypothetical protein
VAPEQRRHPRYSFHSSATFVNERASGFLKISDISDGGCRAESKVPLVPGETCQLLIDLPQKNASINVSEALVRWASGHECGLKFLHIDHDGQGWLHTLTNRAVIGDVLQSS